MLGAQTQRSRGLRRGHLAILTHQRVLDNQTALSLNMLADGVTGAQASGIKPVSNIILAQSWGLF